MDMLVPDMERRESGGRESPGARRLRILRLAEGYENAASWAKYVGIGITQLSNYENGIPISKNAAVQLANRVPGLTTDYLLRGKEEGLSVDLRARLRKAESALGSGRQDRNG